MMQSCRALSLAFAAVVGLAVAPAAAEPRLRSTVTVTGPLVTLGDLFTGAGDAAATAVFQAPEPGTTGLVSATRVLNAAAAHGLENAGFDSAKVAVTRASRYIAEDELNHALVDALHDRLAPDAELEIVVDQLAGSRHIEADAMAPVAIGQVEFDEQTGRFAAVMSVADSSRLAEGARVTGRAMQMVELPVLQRQVNRGETIGSSDVAMRRMPLSSAPVHVARSLAEVVGKSARSTLRGDAPVPADRLMEPILVSRNDAVTIIYRSGGLVLTVRGRSLGEGARGDLVTVMNNQSSRTLEAVVAGPGQVAVEPSRSAASRLASN